MAAGFAAPAPAVPVAAELGLAVAADTETGTSSSAADPTRLCCERLFLFDQWNGILVTLAAVPVAPARSVRDETLFLAQERSRTEGGEGQRATRSVCRKPQRALLGLLLGRGPLMEGVTIGARWERKRPQPCKTLPNLALWQRRCCYPSGADEEAGKSREPGAETGCVAERGKQLGAQDAKAQSATSRAGERAQQDKPQRPRPGAAPQLHAFCD